MPTLAALLGLALFLPGPVLPPAIAQQPRPPAVVTARVPGWVWPLDGTPAVVGGFAPPARPWLPGHRGVDLAGGTGDEVRSAGTGVIAFAGVVAGRGVVSVEHAAGLRTTYEPVTAAVRLGDSVGPGSPLGRLEAGHRGCPVAACLHWGLRRGLVYLNPLLLLRPLRIRLKPLTG